MRFIREGKVYDTNNAIMISEYDSGHPRGDFKRFEETLYRTKKGAWFLVGEGGPMTHYGQPCPTGGIMGGDGIQILTEDEAREWCENPRHEVPTSTIERYFSVQEA